ncbi:NAD(P)-binding protein [Hankyongella ginsenosidimutans]|uniref:NAD(P)-binding protein n=1 Tax=Hankyongella ginsenosidimutans TaxID=1763828 RepID=UPI001CA36877|nr:FAD-dependent oxidoreductase [Hankyongella ginsenosidimutans]
MTTPTVHIVGAGLAGLAAGLTAAEAGLKVRLHEAAPRAGGRCRTYWDAQLDARIDNGNHLMMSGNTAVLDLVKRTGAQDQLVGPEIAVYPFIDLETGRRWTVKPGLDRLPLWVLDPARSVPGSYPPIFWKACACRSPGRTRPSLTSSADAARSGADSGSR